MGACVFFGEWQNKRSSILAVRRVRPAFKRTKDKSCPAWQGRSDIPSPVLVPEKGGCLRHSNWNSVDLIFNYSGAGTATDNDLDVSCQTRQDSTARVLAQSVDTCLLKGVIRDFSESEGWSVGFVSKIPSCD